MCIYSKKNYRIIKVKNNNFIVTNTRKRFENGHTHVNNFYIAKSIIYYCLNNKFSKNAEHLSKNKRIMDSIFRVID